MTNYQKLKGCIGRKANCYRCDNYYCHTELDVQTKSYRLKDLRLIDLRLIDLRLNDYCEIYTKSFLEDVFDVVDIL